MSQKTTTLWERVLERDPELKEALTGSPVVKSGESSVDPDPFDCFDPTISIDDDGTEPDPGDNAIDATFEESADLWLSRSDSALEYALLSMGIKRDVFPTNRPLLIFSSRRSKLAAPEYFRVEVTQDGWPRRLESSKPLTSTAAATILASSQSILRGFKGETVAVEVPNPLLARNRWIVLWPKLEELLDPAELNQWRQVRRVVWCVNNEQIGPRDVLCWVSSSWPDIPIRIALFRAGSFVHEERNPEEIQKKLQGVRHALEKFDRIEGHPWVVVEP